MGAGVIGGEVDFGWAPNAFDESVDNDLLDLMANLTVGVPVGGTRGAGIRPSVSGIDDDNKKDFGSNLGGGAMGFFNDHVRLRGDVNFDLGSFDFWRASVGVVLR